MNKRRDKYSTPEQRIQWLLKHRSFLIGTLELTKTKRLVAALKQDGLLAPSTYWCDAHKGIEFAVKQAKLRWYAEHNGREIKP